MRNIFNLFIECKFVDDEKTMYTFYSDICYIALKLLGYGLFFIFTTIYFRIPFNIFREAVNTLRMLNRKIINFINYRKISEALEKCADVGGDGSCPICREEMSVGKAISCGHVFHKHCLKKWVERQQVCPICRQSMFDNLREVSFRVGDEDLRGVPVTYDE
jgi:E3 ubiquitin-protein ligase synoviolin